VSLHPLVRQVDAAADLLPPKHASTGRTFHAVKREGAWASLDCRGRGVGGDVAFVDDDAVVEGSEGVVDSWVFLVDEKLAAVLELEFVGVVRLQGQVDNAAWGRKYFSYVPLSGLKVLAISHSADHSSQLPISLRSSTQMLEEMRTGLPLCFSM
jgi:hypothetical protein